LSGSINDAEFETIDVFNLQVPKMLDGVYNNAILNPRNTWEDKDAYDDTLKKLAGMFIDNYSRYDGHGAEFDFSGAGPQI
jgi:phosphoenolpyruvate carboxykinase (ATP)